MGLNEENNIKTLITGSNGFIGSFLVESLLTQGYFVRCLVRKTSDLKWIKDLPVEFVYGDLESCSTLQDAVSSVDWVFHLAGLTKAKNDQQFFHANYIGVVNLLEACENINPNLKKFIFVSSQAAGGPANSKIAKSELDEPIPLSAYGKAKLEAERAVLDHKIKFPTTVIRPPAVYGPRDTEVYKVFQVINKGFCPQIGGGSNLVTMVHVQDLVDGLISAAQNENADGKVFYISGDGVFSWKEIQALIAKELGKDAVTLSIPIFIFKFVGLISRHFDRMRGKTPLLSKDKIIEIQQKYWLCDNSRAKRELGFSPKISLRKGIKDTVNWYKKNGWL